MNHQKIYNQLMEKARSENRSKGKGIYYENHHIIPRSLGGLNNKDNLVLLTGKEHFLAHHLLAKIHGGKMWYAFWMMCNTRKEQRNYKITARVYEEAKKQHSINVSKQMKGKTHSDATKRKLSEAHIGKVLSKVHRQKLSEAHKGNLHSKKTKEKMSVSQTGRISPMKGRHHSEEYKKNLSRRISGDKNPSRRKEVKEKLSIKARNNTIYRFYNIINKRIFEGTAFDFYTKFKYKQATVSAFVLGINKTLDKKQWVII